MFSRVLRGTDLLSSLYGWGLGVEIVEDALSRTAVEPMVTGKHHISPIPSHVHTRWDSKPLLLGQSWTR